MAGVPGSGAAGVGCVDCRRSPPLRPSALTMTRHATILARMLRHACKVLSGTMALASLAGCASLSEKQCRAQDWYQVGYEDGNAGANAGRIELHSSACAAYGIETDTAQYDIGRADGLQRYCTLARGIETGVRGSPYSGACAGDREAEFLRGYREGRRLYQVLRDLEFDRSRLEGERRQVEWALRTLEREAYRRPLGHG